MAKKKDKRTDEAMDCVASVLEAAELTRAQDARLRLALWLMYGGHPQEELNELREIAYHGGRVNELALSARAHGDEAGYQAVMAHPDHVGPCEMCGTVILLPSSGVEWSHVCES